MTFVRRDRAIFALCVAFCLGMFRLVLPNVAFAVTFVAFEVPGAVALSSINSAGVIAGYYCDGSGVGHGFVRATNATIATFDAPGSNSTFTAINPGAYGNGSGFHGFVPIPFDKPLRLLV